MIEAIIFDNDGTLYDVKPEFHSAVVDKFHEVISKRLGITHDAAIQERQRIYDKHRSTIAGIVREYGWNPAGFVQETYLAVPIDDYIETNPELACMLANLPQRKIILTNNPCQFARRILRGIGIEDQFEHLFGEEDFNFQLKPNDKPFMIALQYLGVNPKNVLFLDNDYNNLETGARLDIMTHHTNAAKILNLPEIIHVFERAQKIARAHSLDHLRSLPNFDKKASTGNKFFACTQEGRSAVLKLGGLTKRSLDEIAGNNSAYSQMAQMGLSDYSPLLFAGEDFQVLEFLEHDLEDMIEFAEEPVVVYTLVKNHLRNIYFKTLKEDRNMALAFLQKVFGNEPQRRYLEQYLLPNGLIHPGDIELLDGVHTRFEKIAPRYVTFTAGGELQPEHLRFSIRQPNQPKIIDPREPLVGNPIIEVAILSELFELYGFKKAKEGKDIMYGLIHDLGTAMQMTHAQVQCLIALGKIRQGTLSARFRFKEHPLQAREQANKAVKAMEEIINADL